MIHIGREKSLPSKSRLFCRFAHFEGCRLNLILHYGAVFLENLQVSGWLKC